MTSLIMIFVASRLCWRRAIVSRTIVSRTCWWLFGLEGQIWWRSSGRLWRCFGLERETELVHVFVVLRIVICFTVQIWFQSFICLWSFRWMELTLIILDVSRIVVSYCW